MMQPTGTKKSTSSPTNTSPAGDAQSSGRFLQGLAAEARARRLVWDLGGLACLALALMTLMALLVPSWTSGLLDWWAGVLLAWLGWGSVWIVSAMAVTGLWMLYNRASDQTHSIKWARVLAMEVTILASLGLLSVLGGASLDRADAGLDGGRIGWGLVEMLRMLVAPSGISGLFLPAIVLLLFVFLGLYIGLDLRGGLRKRTATASRSLEDELQDSAGGRMPVVATGEQTSRSTQLVPPSGAGQTKKPSTLPPEFRKSFRVEKEAESGPDGERERDVRLPPLDLLMAEQSARPDERNINLTAGMIEKTLAEFGIPAKVVGFRIGPTVTQFAVEPGFVERDKLSPEGEANRQKVRVAQIAALQRDLALALAAERLRIEAPVPGRPYVGIEVPNLRSSIVRLRPILESDAFYKVKSPLTIALGRDVSGQPVVADLARMPHLLVAGTTGSGKSVCIAAITACLAMNNPPEELRLVMIDPKMVELVRFNGLPHLLGKVETELERILAVLRWVVMEMDRRYRVLEAAHARNIEAYNRKVRRRPEFEYLPKLVVLIDELADLMMSAPDQTEHNLVRLAQMARAVGIHLVIATQRPSTDVVTGLIKANFPARISFAVASSVDSRVILDATGAESLLGRGDMLFTPPEASAPIRSQGVMITDQEVERVITFWQKETPAAAADAPTPWDIMLEEEQVLADKDDLINKAIAIVRETQRASASMLQRRLRIGYPRAARLIDELEDMGVIGPSQGGGREREVLIERGSPGEYHLDTDD